MTVREPRKPARGQWLQIVVIGFGLAAAGCGGGDDGDTKPSEREGYQKVRGEPIKSAGFYFRRGKRALDRGLDQAAIIDLDAALAKNPEHTDALCLRGVAKCNLALAESVKRKPMKEADPGWLVIVETTEVSDPDYEILHRGFAELDAFDQLVAESLRYDASLEPVCVGRFAKNRAGFLKLLSTTLTDAQLHLTAAIARRSDSAWLFNARAVALFRLGRHADAVADFERALELAPTEDWIELNLATALERLGRSDEALTRLQHALPEITRGVARLLRRGFAFRGIDRLPIRGAKPADEVLARELETAREDLDAAIANRGDFFGALEARGRVLLHLGRFDEALTDFNAVLIRRTGRVRSLFYRAWIYAHPEPELEERAIEGLQMRALADLRRIFDLEPDHALVYMEHSWGRVTNRDDVFAELDSSRTDR